MFRRLTHCNGPERGAPLGIAEWPNVPIFCWKRIRIVHALIVRRALDGRIMRFLSGEIAHRWRTYTVVDTEPWRTRYRSPVSIVGTRTEIELRIPDGTGVCRHKAATGVAGVSTTSSRENIIGAPRRRGRKRTHDFDY